MLHESRETLKRKMSSTSFQDSPIEYTRLRIQDYEDKQDYVRHEMKWWKMQAEHGQLDVKAHRERRVEGQKRIISLRDSAWEQTRLLHDLEEKEQGSQIINPDYAGAFPSTLLSLYKDKNVSKKRKGHVQNEMRRDAIQAYTPGKDAPSDDTYWCPIAQTYFPKEDVKAAHLVPYSVSRGLADYLFGEGSGSRMDKADDCLMIQNHLETSMDSQQSVVIPVDRNETPIKRWRVHITMDDAINKTLYPGTKLGDLDGRELAFKNENRPASRFLYYHFIVTIIICRDRETLGWGKNMDLVTGKPFATWGKWMRTSVLLNLAHTAGDLSLEVEQALRDPNASFPDDRKLSHREEKEVARQCLESSLNKGEEDDEDDVAAYDERD